MLVDSHCHLDFPELVGDLPAVLRRMAANGVGAALCAGVTLERLPAILEIASGCKNIFAAVGVHPDTEDGEEPDVETLIRLAGHKKIVAIGETGLDYYWQKDAPEWQRERFRTHIRAARETGKPLIIHTRSAADDTLRLMREENAGEAGGVMHCFTESWEVAEGALEQGFYISFSGIVSFKNAKVVHETAQFVPLDRLLIETDSPYLAPMPYRGKQNEPAYVRHVAQAIADIKKTSLQEIGRITSDNFERCFLLK